MEIVAEGLRLVIAPHQSAAAVTKAAGTGASPEVAAGASPEVAAGASPEVAVCAVLKAAEENRFTLGVAYPALRADVSKAMDGHRDVMTSAEVEKTAWDWMSRSRTVGLFHADGNTGRGVVVESYIYRADSPWVVKAADGSEQTVYPGDWLTGVIWDDPAWQMVRKGLVDGFSPQGATRRRQPSPELLAQLRRP